MPKQTISHLLKRLRQLRTAHDLTQEQFAESTGISYKYYQAVEAGRKRDLRLSTLERLAVAYGIEVWQLLAPQTPKTCIKSGTQKSASPHYKKRKKTSQAP